MRIWILIINVSNIWLLVKNLFFNLWKWTFFEYLINGACIYIFFLFWQNRIYNWLWEFLKKNNKSRDNEIDLRTMDNKKGFHFQRVKFCQNIFTNRLFIAQYVRKTVGNTVSRNFEIIWERKGDVYFRIYISSRNIFSSLIGEYFILYRFVCFFIRFNFLRINFLVRSTSNVGVQVFFVKWFTLWNKAK